MIFISSHARFDEKGRTRHGTGTEIASFLQGKRKAYVFLRHSLYNGNPTEVEMFNKGRVQKKLYGLSFIPFPFRFFQEQIITFFFLFRFKVKFDYFIGIDPVNALNGLLAKKIGKVKVSIFYTADYAYERFKNPIINWIYHFVDRFVVRNSDKIWNVSSRIVKLREKQGIPREKIRFVPNTPEFRKTKRLPFSKINKHDAVIVGNITKTINYPLIFKGIKRLSKKYKDIRLLVIGSGDYEDELKSLVEKLELGKKIIFLGRKDHEDVLEILSKSAVGIALYTKEKSFSEFGDSMKVREYLACGLPVVMNDVPSTAGDVEEEDVGFILKGDGRDFVEVVDKLFSDQKLYKRMRKNAVSLAKKTDFTKMLEKNLEL